MIADKPHGAASLPINEDQRLSALASYEILDSPFEGDSTTSCTIVSQICDTPIDSSIGAHAILQPRLFEVPDTLQDARFAGNPLVTGSAHLRFYAGAPLRTPYGYKLGTVCVLDYRPRTLSTQQRAALLALSRQTMALMQLRKALRLADSTQRQLRHLKTTAGHDLRQPLLLITLNMEITPQRATDPDAMIKPMKMGLESAKTLEAELDALAVASSAVSGIVVSERASTSLRERFDNLQRMWKPQAERKGRRRRFAPCSVKVMSNPRLLHTIPDNLIGNAITYTDKGGVAVGCRGQGSQVRIDGVDIATVDPSAMFDAIRKADVQRWTGPGTFDCAQYRGHPGCALSHAVDSRPRNDGQRHPAAGLVMTVISESPPRGLKVGSLGLEPRPLLGSTLIPKRPSGTRGRRPPSSTKVGRAIDLGKRFRGMKAAALKRHRSRGETARELP